MMSPELPVVVQGRVRALPVFRAAQYRTTTSRSSKAEPFRTIHSHTMQARRMNAAAKTAGEAGFGAQWAWGKVHLLLARCLLQCWSRNSDRNWSERSRVKALRVRTNRLRAERLVVLEPALERKMIPWRGPHDDNLMRTSRLPANAPAWLPSPGCRR